MTQTIELRGASTDETLEMPLAEHRLVRLVRHRLAQRKTAYLELEGASSTERSQLADLLLYSPHASGDYQFSFVRAKFPEPEEWAEETTYVGLVRGLYFHIRWHSYLLHALGHWRLPGGTTARVSKKWFEFRELFSRLVRNTMAHSFSNPVEAEASEEAVKSSAFLSSLYRTVDEGNENAAMRMIYSYFYQLRMQQDYCLCDRILEDIDERRFVPFLLVALLTITAPLKKNLRQRASFFQRAKNAIAQLRGRETAERILIGLE
jgi:hypothetical protein